jgi:uroporphyrinogen III methyltransferase/synthase
MCLWQPAIEIGPPDDWTSVDAALGRLEGFHWLVFSSANGVRYLLDRLLADGADLRRLADIQLAAIGPGTAEELARYHLKADLVPDEFRAESLAAALVPNARGLRFLLARASRGREILAEELTVAGGIVEQVVVYTSRDVERADPEITAALTAGRIDWVTVTSSAIARSLVKLFGDDLRNSKLVSISPVTSATLRELGHEPAAEAREYTMGGMVDAILASPDSQC